MPVRSPRDFGSRCRSPGKYSKKSELVSVKYKMAISRERSINKRTVAIYEDLFSLPVVILARKLDNRPSVATLGRHTNRTRVRVFRWTHSCILNKAVRSTLLFWA